jgi:ATP-dependent Clp protease protease subunit
MTLPLSSKAPLNGRKSGTELDKDFPLPIQDIYDNTFLKNHVHFLSGDIEEQNVLKAIQWIIYENALSGSTGESNTLQLYVNSTGGDLYHALGLIDMMRLSKNPIQTIGVGAIMSAAFLIFASGQRGHRYITKNCSIMCHQYSDTYEGKHHDLKSFAKEAEMTNDRMLRVLQSASGLTSREVKSKLLTPSDVWLSSEELVKLGIADHIL